MNKFITKLAKLTLGLAMAAGVGVAVGSNSNPTKVNADSYVITFGNNASSATALAATVNASTAISNGTDYVTSKPFTVNSGNCYYGDTKTCIRLGKSGASSSLTISLSDSGTVTASSIVVNANNLNNNKNKDAKLNVNSIGQQKTTGNASNYTFTYTTPTEITSITLTGDKSIYVYSITVNYSSSGGGGGDTPTTYTVTYDDNGATDGDVPTGSGTSYSPDATVTVLGNTGNLAKTGFTFGGWLYNSTSSETTYSANDTFTMPSLNVTLYAKWDEAAISGTFNLYSGEISEGDYIIYYDGKVMKNVVSGDRLQYNTVTPENNSITNPAASIVWHIEASGDYWTLYNAAVDSYAASTGAKNTAQLLTDATDDMSLWTISGDSTYEFVNKKNDSNGVNKNLRENTTYGFACYATSTGGALTLYKKTSPYTLSYSKNGATSGSVPAAATYENGTHIATVVGNSGNLAKTGYNFKGWNTAADGSGTTYKQNDQITVAEGGTTLYAKWIAVYTVDFQMNGHGSQVQSVSVESGSTISKPTPSETDFIFDGWFKDSNLEDDWDFENDKVTENTTLYAGWTRNAYTIVYNSNDGGTAPTDGTTYTAETINSVNLKGLGSMAKDLYTCDGWATSPNGNVAYELNQTGVNNLKSLADSNGQITLYAHWAKSQYLISFNTSGGNTIEPQKINIGSSIETLPTPTKTDYYFLGWKEHGGSEYIFSPYTPTSDATLVAQWTLNTLSVTYQANGGIGSVPVDSTIYSYQASVTLATGDSLTKAHAHFSGWSTSTSGASVYPGGSSYTITQNTIMYAIWVDHNVTSLVNVDSSTPTKTEYIAGESFDPSGLVIHAVYDNDEGECTDNIASSVNWGDPLIYGQTSVTGTYSGQSITINGLYVDAETGTVPEKPFTIAQAINAAINNGPTASENEYYAVGYIKKMSGKNIWLVDSHSEMSNEDTACLEGYNTKTPSTPTGVDFDNDIYSYDKVLIRGKLIYYQSNQPEFHTYSIVEWYSEDVDLEISLAEDTLFVGQEFKYNGVITANYTIAGEETITTDLTFTGYNMSAEGNYTVTVSWDSPIYQEALTQTYTLHVVYATVTEVSIDGPSSIKVTQSSEHTFTYTTNDAGYIDPSTTVVWSAINAQSSEIPTEDFLIDDGVLTVTTDETGALLISVTVGGVTSNVVTVNVTGNPVPTLDKTDLYGFIGDNEISIKSSVEGGTAPYTYAWSLPNDYGVAEIPEGYDDMDETLVNLVGRGETTITLTVTDSNNKVGIITADIHVTETLNEITSSSKITGSENIMSGATWGQTGTSGTGSALDFTNGDFSFSGTKGYKAGDSEIRIYKNSSFTVRADENVTIKTIKVTADSGYSPSALPTAETIVNSDTYTCTVNAQARLTSITIKYEKAVSGSKITETDYFSQNAVIEFAEALTSNLNAVCDQTTGATDTAALAIKWKAIKDVYDNKVSYLTSHDASSSSNSLDTFKLLVKCANPDNTNNPDKLERALSSYNYVFSKYHEALSAEGVGGDFLTDTGKTPVSYSPKVNLLSFVNSENQNTIAIIVIISMVSVTAIGGYFFLRRRKEQ